ncbi:hypothetical protein [Paraburkholderia elongata]|uniref:Uncharacterized protein n=1 Tax=Paraburkholderia elongata TaxID=2675747 RepID=A0A972SPP8_9BURK|nr:hypothetical protein [Paraburkholderia elongata]NPT62457.1 hypothetical protein [Paraburkholderia elongata]
MTSKHEELARRAVEMLADFDAVERELKFKAGRLIQGYVRHIDAPAENVKFVPIDASGQVMGGVSVGR